MPEHKETLRRASQEESRKKRPELSAQEIEQIERAIAEAFRERRRITLRVWGEYEDIIVSGGVATVQTYLRVNKLSTAPGEWEWIKVGDILSAELTAKRSLVGPFLLISW
ncbi:YolD-like family protein [Paenibacillus phoenicis]|uniref:YolD-like family protein n=1 Tax=Paenibacillus phoenicis TaxID=554117 RepID=UPI003D2B7A0D